MTIEPRVRDRVLCATAVGILALAGCGGGDGDTATEQATTTAVAATSSSTTSTTPDPVDECTPDDVFGVVEEKLGLARLSPGSAWDTDSEGAAFTDRTLTANEFRDLQGLDCAVRAVQRTDGGDERLLLAAWTAPRITFVVQATDGPDTPYQPDAVFQLLIEQPRGEHLEGPYRPNREQRDTYAATLSGGETIVISAFDYSIGATAKHWQAGVERPTEEDGEQYVTLDAERHGIDNLRAAGARNVDIAELPEIGSEVGALQFVSSTGQIAEARIAPPGWFDPSTEWHQRPVTTEEIGRTVVYVSESGPPDDADILTYDIAHFSFTCGDYVWQVITGFGTTDELRTFVTDLVERLDC